MLCVDALEKHDSVPDIVFLEASERVLYIKYKLGSCAITKYDTVTQDDLRRILALLRELFFYNIQLFKRMVTIDQRSFPCFDAKTASNTIRELMEA